MDLRSIVQTDAAVEVSLGLELGRNLYKYGMRDHIVSMLQQGVFRIGTLLDYQNEEDYGNIVGDSGEGTRILYDHANYDFSDPDSVPGIAREFFSSKGGGKVRDLRLHLRHQVQDRYIFCVSLFRSAGLMEEFGYDDLLQIDHPLAFFHELNMQLRSLGLVHGNLQIRSCVYKERLMHHTSADIQIDPAFLKDPKYSHQKEVRAIWAPTQNFIRPIFIQCPQATKFCTHPRLPQKGK